MRTFFLALAGTFALAGGLTYAEAIENNGLPPWLPMAARILLCALLMIWGWQRKSLTAWIMVAMVIGLEVGLDFKDVGHQMNIVNKIFVQLIKTVIGPLLFATLVVGIAGHSNMKQVGRMGWKSLLYFEVVTTIALFIGLGAINLTRAGEGIEKQPEPKPIVLHHEDLKYEVDPGKNTFKAFRPVVKEGDTTWQRITAADPPPKTGIEPFILEHVVPSNIAKAVYEGSVLQIVIFSILFGIGLSMVKGKPRDTMLAFSESLAEVMFKFTALIMYMAPIAVGAAIAYTVSDKGIEILRNLGLMIGTLYGALIVFILLVFVPVALLMRIDIRKFIKAIAEPVSIAFATTSSEAALPKAMKAMEDFGVPRKTVSFVMPMGYSFNLDGTTLYLALASMFVAQACGADLTLGQQLTICFTLMLTSKGVAGVPRASLVILFATVESFSGYGLQMWPIYLIMGVDEIMDMARTSVNLIGNCLASCFIAWWEGELDLNKPLTPPGGGEEDTAMPAH